MPSEGALFHRERTRSGHALFDSTPELLADSVAPFITRLSDAERRRLGALLWEDVTSEYDERFLTARLARSGLEFSADFRATLAAWAREERQHHEGFLAVYQRYWGATRDVPAELAARTPEFDAFEGLLSDEFRIACLAAYDEFATVRIFTHYLPDYARLGPDLARFVRRVITDEARHYAAFLSVAARGFPARRHEVPAILEEIRAVEGTPYRATFLLDHDDPNFSAKILASAERALLRHLAAG